MFILIGIEIRIFNSGEGLFNLNCENILNALRYNKEHCDFGEYKSWTRLRNIIQMVHQKWRIILYGPIQRTLGYFRKLNRFESFVYDERNQKVLFL